VAGFTSGEGCFHPSGGITKSRNKVGIGVELVFQITQHTRDEELLKNLITYFECGSYVVSSKKQWGVFSMYKIRG